MGAAHEATESDEGDVPESVVPAVPAVIEPDIDPFKGPLDLGIDMEAYVPTPDSEEVIPASGELAVPSASCIDTPALTMYSAGFGIQGYVCSDSEDDQGFIAALGLQATTVTKPGDHVELGSEVLPSPGINFQHIIVDKAVCVIMPSNIPEIITIDQRQLYKIASRTH